MKNKKILMILVTLLVCSILLYNSWDRIYHCEKTHVRTTRLVHKFLNVNSCSNYPKKLVGPVKVLLEKKDMREIEDIFDNYKIEYGGKWSPKDCVPRNNIAILIPYRNRYEQLINFLLNMYPIFIRQELSFGIYLIEPINNVTFNRGVLFNIGFIESNIDANDKWQCHAYHDVDLISENDKLIYQCYNNPFHLSYRISKYDYKPFYDEYFGGVTILRKDHYEKINGFSNCYFGWGGEDDDFRARVLNKNLLIDHPSESEYRYYMHKHEQEKKNPYRYKILETANERNSYDGLNSIKYRIVSIQKSRLFTKFLVYYDEEEIISELNLSNIFKSVNLT